MNKGKVYQQLNWEHSFKGQLSVSLKDTGISKTQYLYTREV